MIKLIFPLIYFIVTVSLYCQQNECSIEDTAVLIPLGKQAELLISSSENVQGTVSLVSEKTIPGRIDIIKIFDEIGKRDTTIKEGISVKFCNTVMMDRKCIVLVITNNYPDVLRYKALIKIKGKDFAETKVAEVYPISPSIEQWFDQIEIIKLYDFSFTEYTEKSERPAD